MINDIEVILTLSAGALSLFWAIFNAVLLTKTKLPKPTAEHDEETALLMENNEKRISILSEKIARSANSFIVEELNMITPVVLVFCIIIFFTLDVNWTNGVQCHFYFTFAFLMGAIVSLLSVIISLKISISANYRMAIMAQKSLNDAFNIAYKVGSVSGFTTIGLCVVVLLGTFLMFDKVMDINDELPASVTFKPISNALTTYCLATSIVAFFGRVGGGLYTKASDVGADLIGKVELEGHLELSNQVMVIMDKLGDYVGSIVGMSSDLYDSMTCVFCALFVIVSNDTGICNVSHLMYPFLIFSVGIVATLLTSIFAIFLHRIEENGNVYLSLRMQALVCTALTMIGIVLVSFFFLPATWVARDGEHHWYTAMVVVLIGCSMGFLVDFLTDFFTQFARQFSKENEFTRELDQTQRNLSVVQFGYYSTLIPIVFVGLALFTAMYLLGIYGICLIAVGMLATMPIGLTIDGFAPICSNAKDISELMEFTTEEEHRLNILNSAGRRFSYTRPGFSISAAFFASVCMYSAFVVRSFHGNVDPIISIKITSPWIFCSLLVGVFVPYSFSALTIRSIGRVVAELIKEFQHQVREYRMGPHNFEADYSKCVEATSRTAIGEIVPPLAVATLIPFFLGTFIHPFLLFGFIPGAILSGFQLSISLSNSTGPWDNTKKLINSGTFLHIAPKKSFYRQSETKQTTLIGETLGDSSKDYSGSALNLLLKMLAGVSMVFVVFFQRTSLLAEWTNVTFH
jgi:H(+)-translocating pyrophosphatase